MVEEHVLRGLEADGYSVEMLRSEKDGIVLYDPKDGHPMYVPGTACTRRYIDSKMRAGYTMAPPSQTVNTVPTVEETEKVPQTEEKTPPKRTYRKRR